MSTQKKKKATHPEKIKGKKSNTLVSNKERKKIEGKKKEKKKKEANT